MKKYSGIFIIITLLLAACHSASDKKDGAEKKVLTVTIEPQRFFLESIAGDQFSVNTLVPPGANHETYEPPPSVMVDLGKSDIYFKVGDLGFENAWTVRLAKNNPDLIIVDCSEGIERIEGDCHHDHSSDHAHDHSHAGDPHVWTSPGVVKIFSRNMLDALIENDPENAGFYQANFEKLTGKVNATDSIIRSVLGQTPVKGFIIYHPALGYFADEYGLTQYSIEFEGKNPSPSQMRNLVDTARKERINTIFVQQGFDMKNAEVIAKEIGAEVYEINPLAYEWDQELIRMATLLARGSNE